MRSIRRSKSLKKSKKSKRTKRSFKMAPGQVLDEQQKNLYRGLIITEDNTKYLMISGRYRIKWDELFSVINEQDVKILSFVNCNGLFEDEANIRNFLENLVDNHTLFYIQFERLEASRMGGNVKSKFLLPQYFSQFYSICYNHPSLKGVRMTSVSRNRFGLADTLIFKDE